MQRSAFDGHESMFIAHSMGRIFHLPSRDFAQLHSRICIYTSDEVQKNPQKQQECLSVLAHACTEVHGSLASYNKFSNNKVVLD